MKASLILISFFSALLFTNASNSQVQNGFTTATGVFDLRVFNGNAILGQAVDIDISGSCGALTTFQRSTFRVDTESPFFEETFSILLTAQATGRRVQLFRNGDCNGSSAVVNGVRLRN